MAKTGLLTLSSQLVMFDISKLDLLFAKMLLQHQKTWIGACSLRVLRAYLTFF